MTRSASLERRAHTLGVDTTYEDADGVDHRVSEATLTTVCDLLQQTGPAPNGPGGPLDDVVVIRGGRIINGVRPGDDETVQLELTLEGGVQLPAATLPVDTLGTVVASPSPRLKSSAADIELAPGVPLSELPHGIHRLIWSTSPGDDHETTVVVAPQRFPVLADRSSERGPRTAVFTPVYAPWSTSTRMPGFDSLVTVADAVRGHGIDCIATLPLFAPGLGSRFDPSPYSPVSRFHLNEVYATEGLSAGRTSGREPTGDAGTLDVGGYVEWPAVSSQALRRIGGFVQALDVAEEAALEAFLRARPDIASYAAFCATDDVPQRVYEVGQWLAERALDTVVADLHDRGVRLALDLPVGSRPDGWEHARWPELFVDGVTIGAPADSFFEGGQDWGLPPINPVVSRRSGHRMWHDLLANAARHADVLRIDHVMQVMRLWWVPVGSAATEGTYVRYPADELLAVAALVAERTGTTMVGEDLGTVAPEMVARMMDWGLAGMYEEVFAIYDSAEAPDGSATVPNDSAIRGGALSLPEVPAGSWAGLRTHDMSPVAAVVSEVDTEPYRSALGSTLGHDVAPGVGPLTGSIVERLIGSDAGEIVVDLHDGLGSSVPHNVPGTVSPQNWSHRLPVPVKDLAGDPGLQSTLAALGSSATERRLSSARSEGQQSTEQQSTEQR